MFYTFDENQNMEKSASNLGVDKIKIAETALSLLPHIYYQDLNKKIIIDKSRGWTHPEMIEMIEKYLTKQPKIIVMLRPIKEIIESLYHIAQKNDKLEWFYGVISGGDPLIIPLQNLKAGIEKYKDYFLFVNYSDLLNKPKETMTRIYDFLEIEPFEHNFDHIENNFPEGDYDLPGLHEVRKKVSKRETGVVLEDDVLLWATYLQKDLEMAFKKAGIKDVF
jgi:sulfotransferase